MANIIWRYSEDAEHEDGLRLVSVGKFFLVQESKDYYVRCVSTHVFSYETTPEELLENLSIGFGFSGKSSDHSTVIYYGPEVLEKIKAICEVNKLLATTSDN